MKQASAAKKPGLISKIFLYFSQVRTETEKVTWPSKEQVKTYTIVVLASSIVVGIMIGVWDWVLSLALEQIFNITS